MAAAARAFCLLSILVVELVIPHLPAEELGAASVALEAGDECYADANESGAAADSACALSALQHHGQKLALETLVADQAEALGVGVGAETEDLADTGVNCKKYGCSDDFVPAHRCQCNSNCHKRKDCCYDYASTCRATNSWTKVLPSHGVHGHPSSSVDYHKYPGFTLRLAEEFEMPIDLETDPIWTWSDGGLKEGQVRFVKQAIRFEGGKMKIEVSKNHGVHVESCSHAEVAYVESKPLVSGELRSRHNMFRYGRYEMRMKAPDVHPGRPETEGNFASTMFVFRDGKFKHWREIDVEIVGSGDMFTNVLNADHTATWSASMQKEAHMHVGSSTRANFHTYAFEWLPERITWYFDGKMVREHTPGHGVDIPHLSGKVIMNLWVFGPSAAFGGKHIKNNHYPMHSEYEYFRFYSWDGDKQYPCQGMGTSCLTHDDHYLSGNNPCDGIPQVDLVDGHKPCQATAVLLRSASSMSKKVVIIGGGISAKHAAETLIKKKVEGLEVTVIQANRFHEWPIAMTMVLVKPELHDKALAVDCSKNEVKGVTYKYDVAVGVDVAAMKVTLRSGGSVLFDALIVATGMLMPLVYPGVGVSLEERKAEVQRWGEAIRKATSVVVAGGGLVGLELAGDIRCEYPDKKLVLLCRGGVLSQWPDDKRQKVHDRLKKMNIEVMTGAFDAPKEPKIVPGTLSFGDKSLHYDVFLPAFSQGANTKFLETAAGVLDAKGSISVNEFLQSKACPKIFAVGVSDAPEPCIVIPKLEAQWTSAADNVAAMLAGKPLKPHKEGAPFMKLPAVVAIGHGPKGYAYLDFNNVPPPVKVCCCGGLGGFPCCPPCWPCCACAGCGCCPCGYCCGPPEGTGPSTLIGKMAFKFGGFHFKGMGEAPAQQTMK